MSEVSILAVKNGTDELARMSQAKWDNLAIKLGEMIPDHLLMIARRAGWIKITDAGFSKEDISKHWTFPSFLESMAMLTEQGKCRAKHFKDETHLSQEWGFINLEDMRTQMKVLAIAWKGHITINVACGGEDEGDLIEVKFKATELIPKDPDGE